MEDFFSSGGSKEASKIESWTYFHETLKISKFSSNSQNSARGNSKLVKQLGLLGKVPTLISNFQNPVGGGIRSHDTKHTARSLEESVSPTESH